MNKRNSVSRKRSAAQKVADQLARTSRKINVPAQKQEFKMVARLNRFLSDIGGETFLAYVPLTITTVPEVPEAVTCDGEVYVLTSTAPLTYAFRHTAAAERVAK